MASENDRRGFHTLARHPLAYSRLPTHPPLCELLLDACLVRAPWYTDVRSLHENSENTEREEHDGIN